MRYAADRDRAAVDLAGGDTKDALARVQWEARVQPRSPHARCRRLVRSAGPGAAVRGDFALSLSDRSQCRVLPREWLLPLVWRRQFVDRIWLVGENRQIAVEKRLDPPLLRAALVAEPPARADDTEHHRLAEVADVLGQRIGAQVVVDFGQMA